MENKYDDFCLCTPDRYAQIAKKYNEQINKNNYTDSQESILKANKLLKENINMLENLQLGNSNILSSLQKIYIKSYSLEKAINGMIKYNNSDIKSYSLEKAINGMIKYNNSDIKISQIKINNINEIKKRSVLNLCEILKNTLAVDSQMYVFTINLIEEYTKL